MANMLTIQGIADRLRDTILVDASGDYFTPEMLLDLVSDAGREIANLLRIPRELVTLSVSAGASSVALRDVLTEMIEGLPEGITLSTEAGRSLEVLEMRVDGLTIPRGSRDEVMFWLEAPAARYPRVWSDEKFVKVLRVAPPDSALVWGPTLSVDSTVHLTVRFLDTRLPNAASGQLYTAGGSDSTMTDWEDGSLWGGVYRDWHHVALHLAASKAKQVEMDGDAAAHYYGLYWQDLRAFAAYLGVDLTGVMPGSGGSA